VGSDLQDLNFRVKPTTSSYCRRTRRESIPQLEFYVAFNKTTPGNHENNNAEATRTTQYRMKIEAFLATRKPEFTKQ